MVLDAEFLSRIQFAFTVGFHILFPTLNLGLALFLAIMEGVWLKTRNPKYLELCKFWTKIFALTFGMGVVSGIVMSYELGTNFGRFTEAVGGVLGSLFAYEVLSAFFLEAGFLGVMLFGWNRVSPKLHYAATFLVMIGTAISAFWIMSANSWMQTPAGYELKNGIFIVKSWWDVIFNPSVHVRFFHMMLASYITTAFVIAAVSAYYLLRKRHVSVAKTCMSFAMWAALIVVPAQILMGDAVGLEVHKYQPLKTAAIEGVWETGGSKPLLLFAVPDQEKQKNFFEIKIPYGASLINTHSLDGELLGLKSVPPKEQPYVPLVFYSFRIMVGIGMLFLLIALTGLYLRIRKRLYESKTFLRICMLVAPLGFLATISGWVTAETGRQPWVVYGLLTTADGASIIPTVHVATSLTLFITVYVIIFGFYLYYLFKTIRKGPTSVTDQVPEKEAEHAFQYMH